MACRTDFGLEPRWEPGPVKLTQLVEQHARLLRAHIAATRRVVDPRRPAVTRRWLGHERWRLRDEAVMFDAGFP